MNFKKVGVVYRKELLEVLRDKRTLFATLVLPVLLYPLLIVGFNAIMTRQAAEMEQQGATIAIQDSVKDDITRMLATDISGIENFSYVPYSQTSDKLYEDKEIQAIVSFRDSLDASGTRFYRIFVQYDKSKERGRLVYNKLLDSFKVSEKKLQKQQLELNGVKPEILELINIREKDTSTAQKKMGMMLGMFLPYIMVIMLLSGASTVAADLVAGEKERRTLETLLVSSAARQELVFGKYLTIITLSMVNVFVNLFSISFSLKFMLANSAAEMSGVQMPMSAIFILLMAMIPLATFFAAVLLSISTFSRNMKEARTYEQPLLWVAMMLAMVSFLPAVDMSNLMALIPIVNIALLFKAVMINEYTLSHLLITIGSTLVLDVLSIWATIKLFTTESVLFRSEDDGGSLKAVSKDKKSFFNPFNGVLYFSLALVVMYYLGTYLQIKNLMNGLLQTQIFIIGLPAWLIIRMLKLNEKEIIRFKAPKAVELLIVPFIAVSAAIIVSILSQLINMIFPFPQKYVEMMGKLFTMDSSVWKVFMVMSLAPGFFEEYMFRGFMMRFFEKYGNKAAIVITALLFASFHLDPFRFLPVFLLGLLLGYLTLRSGSIINSMLSHTINNGLALVLVTYGSSAWLKPMLSGKDELHYWVVVPALIIFILAMYLFHMVTKKGVPQCAE